MLNLERISKIKIKYVRISQQRLNRSEYSVELCNASLYAKYWSWKANLVYVSIMCFKLLELANNVALLMVYYVDMICNNMQVYNTVNFRSLQGSAINISCYSVILIIERFTWAIAIFCRSWE